MTEDCIMLRIQHRNKYIFSFFIYIYIGKVNLQKQITDVLEGFFCLFLENLFIYIYIYTEFLSNKCFIIL